MFGCIHFQEEVDNLRRPETADTSMLLSWDWQAATLVLAAFACLLFFLVAACVFWQHYRYWKKMERMERGYNAGKLNCYTEVCSIAENDVSIYRKITIA